MSTSTTSNAATLLRQHGVKPRRARGQNFLDDPGVLQQIVAAAKIGPSDSILEIGGGFGNLTGYLAQVAGSVVSIEVDGALVKIAQQLLSRYANVRIVHGDVLGISLQALGLAPGYVVAANIPYYITSPILRHLLESSPRPRRIVLTVQKEVGERVCAKPPAMSLLAVSVQVQGTAQLLETIPARAFYPKPKVDSAIVCIDCFLGPLVDAAALPGFFHTVRAGFLQPRKMLRNSLAAGLGLPAVTTELLLAQAGIDPRRRPGTVAVDEWIRLNAAISAGTD